MLYLLEDNRIIDSEKTKYFDLYTRFGFLLEIDGETIIKNIGKIKKQSENVFDLIEVGDLLKHNQYRGEEKFEKVLKLTIWLGVRGFETNDFYLIDDFNIIAIYKPNSNGDYIKVWEKE